MKHAGQSNHNQGSDEWEFEDACKSFHHTKVTKIFHIIIIRDRGKWQHSEHVHAIQLSWTLSSPSTPIHVYGE